MGKSYGERGDKFPRLSENSEDENEEFDFQEYLRKKKEEDDKEKAIEEQIDISEVMEEWMFLSNEEQEEIKKSQQANRESK